MQERIRLIFLGEQGLLQDLRSLNTGPPSGAFDAFFEKLGEVVEQVTAADERRHNMAHLSQWISLKDLMREVEDKCTPGTSVPSKSLVRLQFAPRNPYAHTALTFTSKLPVQYKIQRRQLRVGHEDDYYCAAQLKYLKTMAVQGKQHIKFFCCDDKAKVPIGEPNAAISTGVRGKKSIVPSSSTLVALDHDIGKASLTPSVILECDIPDSTEKSFVRGQVTVAINDSVYQPSSPFRHAALLRRVIEKDENGPPSILLKFTDGGTDQRNTLESVKLAQISLFKSLNLDMLILARCAPGHSWVNPAERIMSILNLGLQNCALERKGLAVEVEAEIKKYGSMAELRKRDLADQWEESIEGCRRTIQKRFNRLSLKDKPIAVMDPVTDEEINAIKATLRDLFPGLDLSKLQKVHTQKNADYLAWLQVHCQMRHYNFQIKKCKVNTCCSPSRLPPEELLWLPDPVKEDDRFKQYDEVKGIHTTEADRPSLKQVKPQIPVRVPPRRVQEAADEVTTDNNVDMKDNDNDRDVPVAVFGEGTFCTGQNGRATIECIECNKPRVLYSKTQLSQRSKVSLTLLMSEFEYTCGSALTPPNHPLARIVMLRKNLCCAQCIELSYYSTGHPTTAIGRKDLCCYCAASGTAADANLKKRHKTVLPLCETCKAEGKQTVVQRPYGKQTGK